MNVLATEYSLSTSSLDIYLAGCKPPHCPGCHNPESWDFSLGKPYETFLPSLSFKIASYKSLVKNIFILGGEPLHQDKMKLLTLLGFLSEFKNPLWLFTRYEIEKVPLEVIGLVDYIKTGPFKRELVTEDNIQFGIKLASTNQRIYHKGDDI